jgi:hypothetical protein
VFLSPAPSAISAALGLFLGLRPVPGVIKRTLKRRVSKNTDYGILKMMFFGSETSFRPWRYPKQKRQSDVKTAHRSERKGKELMKQKSSAQGQESPGRWTLLMSLNRSCCTLRKIARGSDRDLGTSRIPRERTFGPIGENALFLSFPAPNPRITRG